MADNDIAALVSAANKLDKDRAELAEKLEKKADELSRKIRQINDPNQRQKMAEKLRFNALFGEWMMRDNTVRTWLSSGHATRFIASLDERNKQLAIQLMTEASVSVEPVQTDKK